MSPDNHTAEIIINVLCAIQLAMAVCYVVLSFRFLRAMRRRRRFDAAIKYFDEAHRDMWHRLSQNTVGADAEKFEEELQIAEQEQARIIRVTKELMGE